MAVSSVHLWLRRVTPAAGVASFVVLGACVGATEQPSGDAGGGASAATPPSTIASTDALVEGTGFHATGNVSCSMGVDQPAGSCPFGVTREGDGNGMVTITKPDGRKRVVFFEKGRAIGADVSEADPGEFSANREDDTTIVHIGSERYEIPNAVVMGG